MRAFMLQDFGIQMRVSSILDCMVWLNQQSDA